MTWEWKAFLREFLRAGVLAIRRGVGMAAKEAPMISEMPVGACEVEPPHGVFQSETQARWSQFEGALKDLVRNRIFSVVFVKKNGEIRHMTCRFGVTRYRMRPGQSTVQREALRATGHIVVFDMRKRGYRAIHIDRILYLRAFGMLLPMRPHVLESTTTPLHS